MIIELLGKMAEDAFGIKADPSDLERLRVYLLKNYGSEYTEMLEKVFVSGEAAGFLTVNETYFFREPAHFALLLEMLPDFDESGIRICSAASSTGCEAYSIAMLIESFNRGRSRKLSYHIDAFDINHKVIRIASQGLYGERSVREDGSNFMYMAEPYLKKVEYGYQIDLSLKKNINFFVHNLMDALPADAYHLIFFRNAFIYFAKHARSRVLTNLSYALKDNGLLFMGVSETAGASHECLAEMNKHDVFYFQKIKI